MLKSLISKGLAVPHRREKRYISFRKPQRANDSLLEDNIIYHYRDRDLVGLTVLKASDFNSGDSENKINGSENPEMG